MSGKINKSFSFLIGELMVCFIMLNRFLLSE